MTDSRRLIDKLWSYCGVLRDDGVGIPEGRLEQAAAEGHLGVAGSMRGRVQGLGGTIDLHTAPGEGTEWEIVVPRSLRSRHRP